MANDINTFHPQSQHMNIMNTLKELNSQTSLHTLNQNLMQGLQTFKGLEMLFKCFSLKADSVSSQEAVKIFNSDKATLLMEFIDFKGNL